LPSFDMKTVVIIFVLVNYSCAYLMAFTVNAGRKRFEGSAYLLANFVLQSVGMTLALMRPAVPAVFSVILANTLMFSGVIAFVFGAAKFTHRHVRRLPYLAYVALFVALYCQYTYVQPDIRIRTLCFAGMLIPVFLHLTLLLFFPRQQDYRKHCVHTGTTFLMFALLYCFRVYYAYSQDGMHNYFNGAPPTDALINTLSLLLTIFLMYSIQYMFNSRLISEAESYASRQLELLETMERLATEDHLTGIYNRRHIEGLIRSEVEIANRRSTPLSLILCDIDKFKNINDTYGHDMGDKTIVHTTGLLATHLRDMDKLGRWGGEEFIILTPHTTLEQAAAMAERLRALIAETPPPDLHGRQQVTFSFGVAQHKGGMSTAALIKNADQALYRAKQGGRNRVECTPGA